MRCDLIIEGASVIDGTGAPAQVTDVAVESGRILALGDLSGWTADERIKGAGQCLAPGFIDVHTHDDLAVFDTPDMLFKTSQGVTTVVAGNCGISVAPFHSLNICPEPLSLLGDHSAFAYPTVGAYRAQLDQKPAAVNLALLAGHTSLRVTAMGADLDRPATLAETGAMADALRLALQEGAIGFSSGLDYPPAFAAPPEEIIDLARVLADIGGRVYTSHIRDEGDLVVEALQEALRTGAAAQVRTVISHHKCAGVKNHGRSAETLGLINQVQADGVDVALDVYPYTASATSLIARFVTDPAIVLVNFSEPHPEMAGRMLDDICDIWGMTMQEAVARLQPAGGIYFEMDEGDLRRILRHPSTMIGSDGLPGRPRPHPRLWGSFPRVLSRYVRDQKLFSLEQAIHKMTGLSAKTFGLSGRGVIAPDHAADMVLFDPATIQDMADFDTPEQRAQGIAWVMVNGTMVYQNGESTKAHPGRFLAA